MKEHRKNITNNGVLEMMIRAGLKPASELERLRLEDTDDDETAVLGDDETESRVRKGHSKKPRIA